VSGNRNIETPASKLGSVIEGKYEILTLIGEGGMAYVYLARDQHLNKQWAVKEIKQSGDRKKDDLISRSFVIEANMMKKLDHPMLPRIVDITNENGTVYVVMDYIEGQSLDTILKEHGPQPQDSVIKWGIDLCSVLDYLHGRTPPIIYRDMKPANIMLKPDGSTCIIDFGIAREYKETDADAKTTDTTMLGTRGYAAPEQFGGSGQSDVRTDIYCLGATLYHLLTGKSPGEPPYEMFPIRQIDPSFSPGLEKIIAKCTQPNPAARYQSCAELYYALENYEKVDDAYFKKQKRKLRAFVITGVLSIVLLLGGVGSLVARNIYLENSYEGIMAFANAASDIQTKADYYYQAIEVLPEKTDAYLGLIHIYRLDGHFDAAEQERFNNVISGHINEVKKNALYALLAFETGQLYWYYYDYGDSFTGMDMAKSWFEEASKDEDFENSEEAQIYFGTASFITEIERKRTEGTASRLDYTPYFENLVELNNLVMSKDNDVVKRKIGELTLDALTSYSREFKNAGLGEEQLEQLYRDGCALLQDAESLDAQKAQEANEKIRDAYERQEPEK
jgi:serine/threonine-protein kinase